MTDIPAQLQSGQRRINQGSTISRWIQPNQNKNAIEAAMLGLRLRGWLCDSERNLMDLLTPNNYCSFLIRGEKYLHPEGVELFEIEKIVDNSQEASAAIWINNWHENRDYGGIKRNIMSYDLSDKDEPRLILGIFGPDRDFSSEDIDTRFYELSLAFSSAYRFGKEMAKQITDRLVEAGPSLLVNQTSGRIIIIDPDLATGLGFDQKELIDKEFSELKPILSNHLNQGLKMQTFRVEDHYYCLVTPGMKFKTEEGSNQKLSHDIRNKLTSLLSASDQLISRSSDQNDEITELAGIIKTECEKLDGLIRKSDENQTVESTNHDNPLDKIIG